MPATGYIRMKRQKKDDGAISPESCPIILRCCLVALGVCLLWGLMYMPIKPSSNMRLPAHLGWMVKQRDLTQFVHPGNDTAILKPVLNSGNNSLFVIVVVCSSVPHFAARQAIRSTWAQDVHSLKGVHVVFLLGTSLNNSLNLAVAEESRKHNDILQQDFLDTYNNLTMKSVMLLKWIEESELNVKYVMKTDDDMFVNLVNLVNVLKRKGCHRMLLGCLIVGAVPVKDRRSKWFVPDVIFPEHTYPPYLSGTGYVMSRDIIPLLFDTALNTPFFYLEDVFITGVCARRAGLKPINNDGFKFYKRNNNTCTFRSLITAHKMSGDELHTMWSKVHDPSIKCKS